MLQGETLVLVGNPVLNALLWGLLIVVAGYFARRPAHHLIRGLFTGIRRLCRVLARYCAHAESHVHAWTRAALVAQARRESQRHTEWNIERLREELQAELADLPALQQELHDQLSMVEEDYRRSGPLPPDVPGWPKMLEHLGPELGAADPSIKRTLEDLRDGLELQRVDLLDSYRRATRRRYLLLHRTIPHWRRARRALEQMSERLDRLRDRADRVLASLTRYESLRDEQQTRIAVLAGGSLWRFLLSAVGIVVAGIGFAVLGAFLSEPLHVLLGTVPVADGLPGPGTLVMVLYLAGVGLLGLLMLESSRITALIPGVEALGEGSRGWLFWLSFITLVVLAGGAALLRLEYGGVVPSALDVQWGGETAAGLGALLVLLLPFALVFTGVALAGLVAYGRVVLGVAVALILQIGMLVFRLLGSLAAYAGAITVQLYDLVIFLPLWIEEALRQKSWPASGGLTAMRRRLPAPPDRAAGPDGAK